MAERIESFLDEAQGIAYRLREFHDRMKAYQKEEFKAHQSEIEEFRARLGAFLETDGSTLSRVLALPSEGPTGKGPIEFEYGRMTETISVLRAFLKGGENG